MKTDHQNRHTKIIATLGPASLEEKMLEKMASRGMNLARVNCAHGTEAQQQKMVDMVRSVNKKYGYNMGILLDLTGYRIRIGNLEKRRELKNGQTVYMSSSPDESGNNIPFDYEEDLKTVPNGSLVFIDDGRLTLKVIAVTTKHLKLKVIQGGLLKERKGVNIPMMKLKSNIMTDEDQKNLEFGIRNKVEMIAQSFVRNKKDIQRVVDVARERSPESKIIAKIESSEGVDNIDSIVEACDGIMVARGDLGVTVPLYKIPVIQKFLIKHSNRQKKLSITATQMMETMITEGRPTRAEVSDIANAILDGSDYVMLSGETAVGKYPSRCIQVMSQIIHYTERSREYRV